MQIKENERGFRSLHHAKHIDGHPSVLVQESSAVGPYDDALAKPGSSYLWVDGEHRLDREQVAVLVAVLQAWLRTGRLPEEVPDA